MTTMAREDKQFFRFFPVTYQIDIRTAKFLQKFMINDNSICRLFVKQAGTNLKNFFQAEAKYFASTRQC